MRIRFRLLLLALASAAVSLMHGSSLAQPASPLGAASPDSAAELGAAMVRVDGHPLFRVRGLSSVSAAERARNIGERIARAAADSSVTPANLIIAETPMGTQILAADFPLVMISDHDARPERLTRQQMAAFCLPRIRSALESYRSERTPRNLLLSTLYAVVSTLALVMVLAALIWGRRRLERFIEGFLQRRLAGLKSKDFAQAETRRVWIALGNVLRLIMWMAGLLLTIIYLQFALGQFPWTRDVAENIFGYVGSPVRMLASGAVAAIPDILFLLVLALVTRLLLRLLAFVAEGLHRQAITLQGFDPDWAWPTYRIVRSVVLVFAVVVAYPFIPGSSTEAFKGVSLFVGVLVSLGSTSVIGNLLSGYTMIYRRAFHVGDRVQIDDVVGEVMEIRVTVTHIRTPKNEEVILPNSLIMNSKVVNYTALARARGLILHTNVGIGYEVSWRQVEAMLLTAADRTQGVLKDPPPFVLQRGLGDFAVNYELNAHTSDASAMLQTYDQLHRNILDQFNEYGVQIMTPAYEGDPDSAKVVPKSQWYAEPAAPPARSGGSGSDERTR